MPNFTSVGDRGVGEDIVGCVRGVLKVRERERCEVFRVQEVGRDVPFKYVKEPTRL